MIIDTQAVEKIEAAKDHLIQGSWGGGADGTEAVCMMSALVPGAGGPNDCVTAGWPEWLAELNVSLFDKCPNIQMAYQFAHDVAEQVQHDIDYDKARDLFLIATLRDVLKHDTEGVVEPVITLLERRLAGEDVAEEMTAAAEAAGAAAVRAAALAAGAAAVRAAALAAGAAAWSARAAAEAAGAAAWSARAAETAEAAALAAAWAAARANSRQHLIDALKEARNA